jgi:hypothetical protein
MNFAAPSSLAVLPLPVLPLASRRSRLTAQKSLSPLECAVAKKMGVGGKFLIRFFLIATSQGILRTLQSAGPFRNLSLCLPAMVLPPHPTCDFRSSLACSPGHFPARVPAVGSTLTRSLRTLFALLPKSVRQVLQFQSFPHSFRKLPGVTPLFPFWSAAPRGIVTSLLPYLLTSSFLILRSHFS